MINLENIWWAVSKKAMKEIIEHSDNEDYCHGVSAITAFVGEQIVEALNEEKERLEIEKSFTDVVDRIKRKSQQ